MASLSSESSTPPAAADANDYSRFESLDDPDEESYFDRAKLEKEEGNRLFKAADFEGAISRYTEVCTLLKKNKDEENKNEEERTIRTAALSNRAACHLKLRNFKRAIEDCDTILKHDSKHTKALFRRSQGHKSKGMNEMAYRDILLLLDVEPENKPGLKEKRKLEKDLHSRSRDAIRSRIEKDKKEAKEKIRKKEEEKKKKKSKEEAKLRKTEEAAAGGAAGGAAAGGGSSSSSSSSSSGSSKTSASSSGGGAPPAKVNINRDDIVKDESSESNELMRGYKKTKDGKTTSYFTRELDEHAKALMGDIAPKKLTGSGEATRPVERKTSAASAWNSAGTFEERDRSKFCADMLKEKIGNGMVVVESEEYKVEVTGIKNVEGEGSIILRRGKMNFIWDYAFDVTYKISLISNDKICKGTLSFTDFSHDPNDLPSVRKKIIGSGFKNVEDVAVGKSATSALRQRLDEVLNAFRDECKEELGGQ